MKEHIRIAMDEMYRWFAGLDLDSAYFRPRVIGWEWDGTNLVYTFVVEPRPGTTLNPLPPED